MKGPGQMRHPKSQDFPPMLPPFSCFSKCHTSGIQVVGHVLLCGLGVPWAQHRPSPVTQPKIPPGVFLCWEQDQAVASWPPKLPRHCHIPGWSSEAGAAELGGTEGKLVPWKSASLGSPCLWCGKAGSTGMLPVLSFSPTQRGSARNGGALITEIPLLILSLNALLLLQCFLFLGLCFLPGILHCSYNI